MTDHYFTDSPAADERRHEFTVNVWGHELSFESASGVFSRDGLDKATAVLLRTAEPPSGPLTVLDLGCGWGPIAVAIAVANPEARVIAIDVNERALRLTRDNAERNGVSVEAYRPDQVPEEVAFDAIWSNPPIRIGKTALHALLLTWLDRLAPDGEARLVVGKNLGADSLQRWLGDQGWPTERVASQKSFRVLLSRRPSPDQR